VRPRAGSAVRPFYAPGNSRVIDDKTLAVTLKFPSAAFIPWLAFDYAKMYPKHVVANKTQDQLNCCYENWTGSGPWMFKEMKRDSHIMWEKNPNYFKKGLPFFDGYTQFIIKDDARRLASLQTEQVLGTLYASSSPSYQDLKKVEQETGGKVRAVLLPMASGGGLQLNHTKPPFDNPKARRAVMLALDRVQVLKSAYKADGAQALFFPPGASDRGVEWYNVNMPGWRYVDASGNLVKDPVAATNIKKHPDDIAEARRLIKEAGAEGAKIVFRSGNPIGTVEGNAADVLARQIRDALGLDVDLVLTDISAYHQETNKGNFHVVSNSTWFEEADANSMIYQYYLPGGGRNPMRWEDPFITDGAQRQLQAKTLAERKQIVMQMEDVLMKGEGQFVPNLFQPLQGAINVKIRNYHDRVPGSQPVSTNSLFTQEHLWLDPNAKPDWGLGP
jgi:peptide/nickel transport system substrate-binding protein